jgi:hypothetical protein
VRCSVGSLKAVGGTPPLVAALLLVEYMVLALLGAAAGLAAGWLAAPTLTDPGAGLLGNAGAPTVTMSTVGAVTAVALGVAVAATFVPAVRAARTSTVHALTDAARPPRRAPSLIAVSARLPVPLLLGLRMTARRPRRVVLSVVSIAITVTGIVAALAPRRRTIRAPRWWVDRPGAILGIVGGLALFAALGGDETANPPVWQLIAVAPATVLAVAALTAIPARLGARRPAAEILQAELV